MSNEHMIKVPSTITVSATVGKKGHDEEQVVEQKIIDVRKFMTTPASVTVEYSARFGIAPYETAGVTVAVTLPCYVEELAEAHIEASKRAIAMFRAETASFPKNKTLDAVRNAGVA